MIVASLVGSVLTLLSFFFHSRVLDLEPESDEDEDAIIERRRQLRQAIVNKYQTSAPTTPQVPSSPAPASEADSEAISQEVKEQLEEEEKMLEEVGEEEKEERSGLIKKDPEEEAKREVELRKKKTSLLALRESVRNGDMFDEGDLFEEIHLVILSIMNSSSNPFFPFPQSPSKTLISDPTNENPKLLDNWDDDEGYYRKF